MQSLQTSIAAPPPSDSTIEVTSNATVVGLLHKDLDYYLYWQPIPDDGRPNPHLSNFPVGPDNTWATVIAWGYLIIVAIASGILNRYLWKYRNCFPLSISPVSLMIFTGTCCAFMHFAYTHQLMLPMMPCWLHILSCHLVLCGYSAGAFSIQFRLYFSNQVQFHIANNNHNHWFVRHKKLQDGALMYVFFALGLQFVSSFLLVTRFATLSAEVLAAPMADLRCTSFGTAQFAADMVNKVVLLILNQAMAGAVKDVKEAYPFRERHLALAKVIVIFVEFQDVPFFLKQFYHGLDRTIFNTIAWACMLIWSLVICTAFLYISNYYTLMAAINYDSSRAAPYSSENSASFLVVAKAPDAAKRANHLMSASKISPQGEGGAAPVPYADNPALTKVFTLSDLMALLRRSPEVQESFKQYLVREFCAESMVFMTRTFEYEKECGVSASSKASKVCEEILHTFIEEKSLLEINISATLREATVEKLNKALLAKIQPSDIFAETQEAVLMILIDPFHRFQRTLLSKS